MQLLPGTPGTIEKQRRVIEDTVRARLEAIPGVAAVNVNGGPPDEVHITLDLTRAAALAISIPDVASRAAAANNVSGGQLSVGRRQYTLRFTGRFSPEQLGALVLTWRDGRPVRLADVATIEVGPPQRTTRSPEWRIRHRRAGVPRQRGERAGDARCREGRGCGTACRTLKARAGNRAVLRRGALHPPRGYLLTENLIVGALLALLVVWWFMREWRVTL